MPAWFCIFEIDIIRSSKFPSGLLGVSHGGALCWLLCGRGQNFYLLRDSNVSVLKKSVWASKQAFHQNAQKPHEETQGPWLLRASKLQTVHTDWSCVFQALHESFISFFLVCVLSDGMGWQTCLWMGPETRSATLTSNPYLPDELRKSLHLVSALVTSPDFF